MYRELDGNRLVGAAEGLAARIRERFPDAGLTAVAGDLAVVAGRAVGIADRLARPIVTVRIAALLLTFGLLGLIVFGGIKMQINLHVGDAVSLVQGLESLIADIVYTGVAIWFICSIERRVKRGRALKLMSQLRSLAHVIDMHQIDKDPDRFDPDFKAMMRSPKPTLTRMALTRYLDYCSDMLSILGKLAALTVQKFDDPVALAAVNELEALTDGLSRKVWQKIMILDRMGATDAITHAVAEAPATPASPADAEAPPAVPA